MSARTAAQHSPTELTYHGTSGEIAVFSSASASTPGARNFTYRDTVTGEAHCECRGAECGRQCWHLDWVHTAAIMTQVARFVASLNAAGLCATGQAAGARVKANSATVTDIAVYYQCRAEYRRRRAAVPAPVISLPVIATIATAA